MNSFKKYILSAVEWLLIVLSAVAFATTIIEASTRSLLLSVDGFTTFIGLFEKYSVIFAATFVVIAVHISLDHFIITKRENNRRWKKERKAETLKHCQYYLNELQVSFKDLIQNEAYKSVAWPLEWKELNAINREELQKHYPKTAENLAAAEKALKSLSLITLYKLDSFASLFIHKIVDEKLGKKVIGYLYSKQVAMLVGLIAYYKPINSDPKLFQNCLTLLDRWQDEIKTELLFAVKEPSAT